jgi:hypothetical protein
LKIDDGTGVTELTLLNQDPRQFSPIDTQEYRAQMIKDGKTTLDLDMETISNLIGKEIEAYGTAEKSDEKGKFTFNARRVIVVAKP